MDAQPEETSKPDTEIIISDEGALALVTLNRVRAYNAINYDMRRAMSQAIPVIARNPEIYAIAIQSNCEKAFSAGADVRQIAQTAQSDLATAKAGFKAEYTLNWLLDCFIKPTVSLIDGMVIGSGVGISTFGTHRVAGERYKFSMPETAIGLFPDVGVASILAKMPNEIGTYLGLTGARVGRADAYDLGLVTHCIGADQFAQIRAELSDAQPVDPILDDRHVAPGPGDLPPLHETIASCFGAPTVEEVIERLNAIKGAHQEWAGKAAADLMTRSPISLKVTLEHLRRSKTMDLHEILAVDYRLACRFLEASDFFEGVRAALIDKDGAPKWQPATLNEVTPAIVQSYFKPMEDDELVLPSRHVTQGFGR